MKKIIVLFSLILSFAACKKEDKCTFTESGLNAPVSEITYLSETLAANNIAATQHPSGVFYFISAPGSGSSPSVCSNITVKYTGSIFPSGRVFDQTPAGSPGVSFTLGQLIVGWQKVLPLLKPGGKMTMYVPPTLGYGSSANAAIPAYSYLKFEIELVSIQ